MDEDVLVVDVEVDEEVEVVEVLVDVVVEVEVVAGLNEAAAIA